MVHASPTPGLSLRLNLRYPLLAEHDLATNGTQAWPATLPAVGKIRGELLGPASYCLVGHSDTAFSEDQLNIAQAEAEHVIQPDSVADDLGREQMTVVWVGWSWHAVVTRPPCLLPALITVILRGAGWRQSHPSRRRDQRRSGCVACPSPCTMPALRPRRQFRRGRYGCRHDHRPTASAHGGTFPGVVRRLNHGHERDHPSTPVGSDTGGLCFTLVGTEGSSINCVTLEKPRITD